MNSPFGAFRILFYGTTTALALFAVTCEIGCSKHKTDEEMIRDLIDSAQKAAKDRRPGGVIEHLTEDFHDNHGNDKQMVKAVLLREMLTNNNLGVYITTRDVTVDGDEASAQVKVIVTGSSGWMPEHADHIRIEMKLRKSESKWKVFSADWKPASEQ